MRALERIGFGTKIFYLAILCCSAAVLVIILSITALDTRGFTEA